MVKRKGRVIRASEIGSYLYCERAWWYQAEGKEPENLEEMSRGSDYHQQHGRQVFVAGLMRIAGWVVLLAAFVLLAVVLTMQWLGP